MKQSAKPSLAITSRTMELQNQFTRREILKAGLSGVALCMAGLPIRAFAFPPEQPDEELVPFLGMPRTGDKSLDWETLGDWLTPQEQAFNVQHYGIPDFDTKNFKLEITGLVAKAMALTMAD